MRLARLEELFYAAVRLCKEADRGGNPGPSTNFAGRDSDNSFHSVPGLGAVALFKPEARQDKSTILTGLAWVKEAPPTAAGSRILSDSFTVTSFVQTHQLRASNICIVTSHSTCYRRGSELSQTFFFEASYFHPACPLFQYSPRSWSPNTPTTHAECSQQQHRNIMSSSTPTDQAAMMKDILDALKTLQINQAQLASNVDAISGRVNVLAGMKEVREVALPSAALSLPPKKAEPNCEPDHDEHSVPESPSLPATAVDGEGSGSPSHISTLGHARKMSTGTSRIILTWVLLLAIILASNVDKNGRTYPGQSGINPFPMDWGHKDPQQRGPVVVSRNPTTIRRRNGKYL